MFCVEIVVKMAYGWNELYILDVRYCLESIKAHFKLLELFNITFNDIGYISVVGNYFIIHTL